MSTKAKVKEIVLNRTNVQKEILQGEGTRKFIEGIACDKLAILGEGYDTRTNPGRKRVNVFVEAKSKEAIQDNLENNTLLKVFGIST